MMGIMTVRYMVQRTGQIMEVMRNTVEIRVCLQEKNTIDEFHVFSLVWNSSSIRWYVDNSLYHTMNTASMTAFQNKFFFILNIAVEGNWPGPVGPSTQFPQYMLVDYIRVFQ